MNALEELFKDCTEIKDVNFHKKFCRTCKHRMRYELNERSKKIVQVCGKQYSSRNFTGHKKIKVTDMACFMYKEESKDET